MSELVATALVWRSLLIVRPTTLGSCTPPCLAPVAARPCCSGDHVLVARLGHLGLQTFEAAS